MSKVTKLNWRQRLVRKWFPSLLLTRPESHERIAQLQYKLDEKKRELKVWQDRCIDVEQLYAKHAHAMVKDSNMRPGLSWRTLTLR